MVVTIKRVAFSGDTEMANKVIKAEKETGDEVTKKDIYDKCVEILKKLESN